MRAFFQNELKNNQKKEGFISYKTVAGRFNLIKQLIGSLVMLSLAVLLCNPGWAGDFNIGGADGSFESDFSGMTTTGDVRLVPSFGSLSPTQGVQAAVLTTEPDDGATLADADISLLSIENFTIPADAEELRLDYNFLTDELTPSFTNDLFSVKYSLLQQVARNYYSESIPLVHFSPLPGQDTPGRVVSGPCWPIFPLMQAALIFFTLALRIADVGDGRGNSAVLIDNMQFTLAGEPYAVANIKYLKADRDEVITFDATGSTDDGAIVEYRWDFGNGVAAIGPIGDYAYGDDGIYQGTLTVTDDEGNKSIDTFTVVVGDLNHGPAIISSPNTLAAEEVPYNYGVQVDDPELAFGDVMTYSLDTGPAGMTIDSVSGVVSWAPPVGGTRKNDVTVRVEDSAGLSDTQSFTVMIGPEVYIVATDDNASIYTARSNGDGTFSDFHFVDDFSYYTRGAAIADFDHDGDFDFVTGHGYNNPRIHLYYYEKQGAGIAPPVYLGSVGDSTYSAGTWLEDMAAEDFNNDGHMDFVVGGDSSYSWLFTNKGALTFGEETFFSSGFETGNEEWGGAQCSTSMARDDTTATNGTWSMRLTATANNSCMSIDINPTGWEPLQGPEVSFAYRIPSGVPTGLLFNVSNKGWVYLGGSPAADGGVYSFPEVPKVNLIDDDQWHTVTFDLYSAIKKKWPDAGRISEFEWWTNSNATAGQQAQHR